MPWENKNNSFLSSFLISLVLLLQLKNKLQILTLGIGGVGLVSAYVSYSLEIAARYASRSNFVLFYYNKFKLYTQLPLVPVIQSVVCYLRPFEWELHYYPINILL